MQQRSGACSAQQLHTQQQQFDMQAAHQVQQPAAGSAGRQAAPVQGIMPCNSVDLGLLPFPSVDLVDILDLDAAMEAECTAADKHQLAVAAGQSVSGGPVQVQPGSTPAGGSIKMQRSSSLNIQDLFAAASVPLDADADLDDGSAEELLLASLLDAQSSSQWCGLVGAAYDNSDI